MLAYSYDLDLDLPRDQVVELFSDHNNAQHWQPTLLRIEHVSGESRQKGAVHRLYHKMGKREVEMTESIDEASPPNRFVAIYEADKVWNRFVCEFTELEGAKTRWHMETEFQCGGIMRLMMIFAPGMFKKQTRQSMQDFKTWAESL